MAAYAGIAGHDHRLPDLSPAGFAERVDLDRRALAAARAAVPVDEREQLAQDAFVERLGLKVEMAEAGITSSQVSVTAGPLQNVRGILDLMPTEGEEAQRNIAQRLAAVPAALEGYQETLRDAAAARTGLRPATARRGRVPDPPVDGPGRWHRPVPPAGGWPGRRRPAGRRPDPRRGRRQRGVRRARAVHR